MSALAAAAWWIAQRPRIEPRPIGLFSSLPILWAETATLEGLLQPDTPAHWAKGEIEQNGKIVPLDTLEALRPALTRLIVAQPRPFAPAENVALDDWVRGGGALLLFADPVLTDHSQFAVGDLRRPQDIALLSPILARWGLTLTFDDGQAGGVVMVDDIPANLAGQWRTSNPDCRIERHGVVVQCQIGKGTVLAVADAEVLAANDERGMRASALAKLLEQAFSGA